MKRLFIFIALILLFVPLVLSQESTLQTNNSSEEIKVPDYILGWIKPLFKLQDENVSVERFIILIACFAMILVLLLDITRLFPIERSTQVPLAIFIALFACFSGGINFSAIFLTNFAASLNFSKYGPLTIFIVIVIMIIILFVINKLVELGKVQEKEEEAEEFKLKAETHRKIAEAKLKAETI
jgi:hypothetical protein